MVTNLMLNEIAETIFGDRHVPRENFYLALSTTDTSEAVTEPSGGGYARLAIPNNASSFGAGNAGTMANTASFTFPTATASWGTVTHYAIYTAATGGSLLMNGALAQSKSVGVGTTLVAGPGELTFTVSAA